MVENRYVAAVLIGLYFFGVTDANADPLEGWGDFKFGMSASEVLEEAGATAMIDTTTYEVPTVKWSPDVAGQTVKARAWFANDKLDVVTLSFPDVSGQSMAQCRTGINSLISALQKRYGGSPATKFSGDSFWVVTLGGFGNEATIDVQASFFEAMGGMPPRCSNAIFYRSNADWELGL